MTKKLFYYVYKNPVINRLLKEIICSCTLKLSCLFIILNKLRQSQSEGTLYCHLYYRGSNINSGKSNCEPILLSCPRVETQWNENTVFLFLHCLRESIWGKGTLVLSLSSERKWETVIGKVRMAILGLG